MTVRYSLAEGQAAAEQYVRTAGKRMGTRFGEGALDQAPVTYLEAGIMNYVYRVDLPGGTYFLKQALDRVKQHDRLGPDLAAVPPSRIQVEFRALALLQEALPERAREQVPTAAWYDVENNILWTEGLEPNLGSLQESLERGECDPVAAEDLGRLLGAVHRARGGRVPPLWSSREEDRVNWERFLRMRTVGVLERASLPRAAAGAVQRLFEDARLNEREGMLSHLDAAPKNVLMRAGGRVALLDFELGAAISDPAYDPGFLAGHYLLMGENRPGMRPAAREAVLAIRRGYSDVVPRLDRDWDERVMRYAGMTMLYRLYGSSPAAYLSQARYESIRSGGIRFLTEGHG